MTRRWQDVEAELAAWLEGAGFSVDADARTGGVLASYPPMEVDYKGDDVRSHTNRAVRFSVSRLAEFIADGRPLPPAIPRATRSDV